MTALRWRTADKLAAPQVGSLDPASLLTDPRTAHSGLPTPTLVHRHDFSCRPGRGHRWVVSRPASLPTPACPGFAFPAGRCASGYFVIYNALGGGVVALGVGYLAAWIVAAKFGPGFGKELAGAIAGVLVTAGIVAAACRGWADVAPTLDGRPLNLEVEFRFPDTQRADTSPTAKGKWLVRLASIAGQTQRGVREGKVHADAARIEEGRWIVPATVPLHRARPTRRPAAAWRPERGCVPAAPPGAPRWGIRALERLVAPGSARWVGLARGADLLPIPRPERAAAAPAAERSGAPGGRRARRTRPSSPPSPLIHRSRHRSPTSPIHSRRRHGHWNSFPDDPMSSPS